MPESLTAADLEAYFSRREAGDYRNFKKLIEDLLEKGLNLKEPGRERCLHALHEEPLALFAKELAHRLAKPEDFKSEDHPARSSDLKKALEIVDHAARADLNGARYLKLLYRINSLVNLHVDDDLRTALEDSLRPHVPTHLINYHPARYRLETKIHGSGMSRFVQALKNTTSHPTHTQGD